MTHIEGPDFDRLAEGRQIALENAKLRNEMRLEIERLRAALKFVHTDPCFKYLGSMTHDTVTDALGLTNILNEQLTPEEISRTIPQIGEKR